MKTTDKDVSVAPDTADKLKCTTRRVDDPEPWPMEVDGDALMKEVVGTIERYCVLPPGASTAIGLWVVHTYAMDAWSISPILLLRSPDRQCGKTTLLSLLEWLTLRPELVSNITAAGVFRTVDLDSPTLLIDEGDRYLRTNEELIGILNSGFTRAGARVRRIERRGDRFVPVTFSSWSPKAVAMIGRPPGTLEDRSIMIMMRRKLPNEKVERLRVDRLPGALAPLRSQMRRWAIDNTERLKEADPELPAELSDRAQDCWRPLVAIADLAGGRWPTEARKAALMLSGVKIEEEASLGIELLSDLYDIFGEADGGQLATNEILAALNRREDRPWGDMRFGKGLSAHQMAKVLREFTTPKGEPIKPRDIWMNGACLKGYHLEDFTDAFLRYLPHKAREARGADIDQNRHVTEAGPRAAPLADLADGTGGCLQDLLVGL